MVVAQPNYYNDFSEVKRLRDILSCHAALRQISLPRLPVLVIERRIYGTRWISLTFLQFRSHSQQIKGVWNNFIGIWWIYTPTEHISGQRCSLFKQQRPCCSLSWHQSSHLDPVLTHGLHWRSRAAFSKIPRRQYSPDWKLQVGESSSSKYDLRKISFEFLDGHIWKILCKCHLDDCRSLKTVVQEDYFVGRKNTKAR